MSAEKSENSKNSSNNQGGAPRSVSTSLWMRKALTAVQWRSRAAVLIALKIAARPCGNEVRTDCCLPIWPISR